MVDVAHHRNDGRPRAKELFLVVVVILFAEVASLKLCLFLFTGIDEPYGSSDLGGKKLDHVVGKRHRGRHHLALREQEPHNVCGATVQARRQLLGRGTPFDDDFTLRHGSVRGHICRRCLGLQLFTISARTPAPARATPAAASTRASAGTTTWAPATSRRYTRAWRSSVGGAARRGSAVGRVGTSRKRARAGAAKRRPGATWAHPGSTGTAYWATWPSWGTRALAGASTKTWPRATGTAWRTGA